MRLVAAVLLLAALAAVRLAPAPAVLHFVEPLDEAVFPPEFPAPLLVWSDPASSPSYHLEVTAGGRSLARLDLPAQPLRLPDIDPRAVAETNRPPQVDATLRSYRPAPALWAEIKRLSLDEPAVVTLSAAGETATLRVRTSRDPVGAPIFYRDVPLMPTEVEKGVIKPIVPSAVPLVAWRLRDVARPESRLLMDGLPTCANCHSFSADGAAIGLDVDGPQNDKGMYAIADLAPDARIETRDVFTWNDFAGKPEGHRTLGFIAQLSPDGTTAVTTVNEDVFVDNFKDYRFLQVFYPTRGILAWRARSSPRIRALSGADNPAFVQAAAFWTPDGRELIFSRALARDAYPPGRALALFANDPLEPQIQYDLYRIPFQHGKGGIAKPVAGASHNGKSNSFPKVSPDGRWLVYIQARNGLLMRPDGELYIVPAEGGAARRLRANTPLMNSWHSWSPNSRWLVFASKARSPYTQLLLTHIDADGNDSPAILLENTTAPNRAANLPEFVNRRYDDFRSLAIPAADFYRLFDEAYALMEKGRLEASIETWNRALALQPDNAKAHSNLGQALAARQRLDEAIPHWRRALALNPAYTEARNNLAAGLLEQGQTREAQQHLDQLRAAGAAAPEIDVNQARALLQRNKPEAAEKLLRQALLKAPRLAQAHLELGLALLAQHRRPEALASLREAIRLNPSLPRALTAAALLLSTGPDGLRSGPEALMLADRAVELTRSRDAQALDALACALAELGRFEEAIGVAERASTLSAAGQATDGIQRHLRLIRARLTVRDPL